MTDAVRPICIFGGTGDVGRRLTRLIVQYGHIDLAPFEIIQISRRAPFSKPSLRAPIRHLSLDVQSADIASQIPAKSIIVNLTEATPPALAAKLVEDGHIYIETSATPSYLTALQCLIEASSGSGIGVLYVGTAPGLTNLMAAHIADNAHDTSQIDIGIEIGMGRHHGHAATQWFFEAAGESYPVIVDNHRQMVHAGDFTRKFAFDRGERGRLAIGYGFAEQLEIAEQSESLSTVRVFIALDPPWATQVLWMALALGLRRFIAHHASYLSRAMTKGPRVGKIRTRLLAEGRNDNDTLTKELRIVTGDQAEVTAAMLFAVVQAFFRPAYGHRTGLVRITDVITLDDALSALKIAIPGTQIAHYPENELNLVSARNGEVA